MCYKSCKHLENDFALSMFFSSWLSTKSQTLKISFVLFVCVERILSWLCSDKSKTSRKKIVSPTTTTKKLNVNSASPTEISIPGFSSENFSPFFESQNKTPRTQVFLPHVSAEKLHAGSPSPRARCCMNRSERFSPNKFTT